MPAQVRGVIAGRDACHRTVTRFKTAAQLCSWAGLTPRHRESDTKVTRGHVTKQDSQLLRWAVIEAVQRITATR